MDVLVPLWLCRTRAMASVTVRVTGGLAGISVRPCIPSPVCAVREGRLVKRRLAAVLLLPLQQ